MQFAKKHWRSGVELGVGLSTGLVINSLLKAYTPIGTSFLGRTGRAVGILCLSTVLTDSATKSTLQTIDNYVDVFKRANEEAKRNG